MNAPNVLKSTLTSQALGRSDRRGSEGRHATQPYGIQGAFHSSLFQFVSPSYNEQWRQILI